MNAIKKVTTIKNTINELGGTFVSLVNENEVLVKDKNNAVWQIPFIESTESYVFDGTKATKVQKGRIQQDPIKTNTAKLRKGITNIFKTDNYDEAISTLKSVIKNLPYIEAEQPQKCEETLEGGKKCTGTIIAGKCTNANCPSNAKDKKVLEKNEFNSVTDGAKKMDEMFAEFNKSSYLFDESGDINLNAAITPMTTFSRAFLMNDTDVFLEKIGQYKKIKQLVSSTLESAVTDEIFSVLDWSENFDTALAKALTIIKTRKESINILETRKVITDAIKAVYNEEVDMTKAAPWIYNLVTPNETDNSVPFLKFRTGAYTYESLKLMSAELDKALGAKDLTVEELEKLGNYRMIVEYMLQSKQINDHVLTSMVEEFNKLFVKTDEQYKECPLGWRSRDEQMQGWTKGFASAIDRNLTATKGA
jgi:hypothetical protein